MPWSQLVAAARSCYRNLIPSVPDATVLDAPDSLVQVVSPAPKTSRPAVKRKRSSFASERSKVRDKLARNRSRSHDKYLARQAQLHMEFILKNGTSRLPKLPLPDPANQPFRLLDLPDELWSKIGKMVIDDIPSLHVALPPPRSYFTTGSLVSALLPNIDYNVESFYYYHHERIDNSTYFIDKLSAPEFKTPAVLQTCSALRNELRLYYYSSNKIGVTMGPRDGYNTPDDRHVGNYLRAIGADARRQLGAFEVIGVPLRRGIASRCIEENLFGRGDLFEHEGSYRNKGIRFTVETDRKPCTDDHGGAGDCGYDTIKWKLHFQ
ncbi:unnamed protein product [Zymoseptoria tritici ST99CH_3D1]|nr:unnamed protein product [Zymoseptoria tritici ST99CH_3D1]